MANLLVDLVGSEAPEFKGTKEWFNSPPLTIKKLKGKVVMLDFWTYSCNNCIRTLPHLKELDKKYSKQGLVVIGVHTPEFEFEKDADNIKKAVEKHGLKYPVVNDPENSTWKLYGNRYWPRQALIDAKGIVRYEHNGEGGYEEIEENIVKLLGEAGKKIPSGMPMVKSHMMTAGISPEIYLGSKRSKGFGNSQVCVPGSCIRFVDQGDHKNDVVYLDGDWEQEPERIHHPTKEKAIVSLKYKASVANAVLSPFSSKSYLAEIFLDGRSLDNENKGKDVVTKEGKSFVKITKPDLYEIVKIKRPESHELKIVSDSPEFTLYTFTFG